MYYLEFVKLREVDQFLEVIANVDTLFEALPATKKHFTNQVRIKLILQLVNDISMFHQKLLRYFNGTIISAFLVVTQPVRPVIFSLNFKRNTVIIINRKMNNATITV